MLPQAESIQIILPILSILFLVLTFIKPIYGTISYFIILNAKIGSMYPALGAIRFELLAAVIVSISIFLSKKRFTNASPFVNELNKPLWILFVVGMISVPQSLFVDFSWEYGGYNLLKMVIFYVMVVCSINDEKDLRLVLLSFSLVTAWIAYEPVVNYLNGIVSTHKYGDIAIGRFGAAAGHVALSNTINQGIPIIYFQALMEKNKVIKSIFIAILVLLVLGVIFTKSRGGFVGLVIISAGLIYFSKKRAKAFAIAAAIFIFLLPLSGDMYLDRISTIADGIHGSRSTSDRYLGLVNGISMGIKRPIMGVGIGCYPKARKYYFNYYFWSHNLYGELFGELGLCSIFWFYWIYAIFKKSVELKKKIIRKEDDKEKYIYNILIGIQISLALRLILGNFTHGSFIWFWFFMAALVVGIENIKKERNGFAYEQTS